MAGKSNYTRQRQKLMAAAGVNDFLRGKWEHMEKKLGRSLTSAELKEHIGYVNAKGQCTGPQAEETHFQDLVLDMLIPCLQLINAYAVVEDSGASIDWSDVDQAYASAVDVVENNFDLQKCGVCRQYFVPGRTGCECG